MSHKKELLCFFYQYAIWISLRTYNRLRGGVPYFFRHGTIPSYQHIKIRVVRVYIINGWVTRKKLDDRSHCSYFMGCASITGVIIFCNLYHSFVIHRAHHVWFDEYNSRLSI